MKIVLASINPIWNNKVENKKLCMSVFEQISNFDVDLLIFPEMTLTGFAINSTSQAEDLRSSSSLRFFEQQARKHGVGVIFGLTVKGPRNLVKNSAIILDRFGSLIGKYCKIHPFSFSVESNYISPGEKIEIVDFEGLKIGLTVCYDLRFPELYSSMTDKVNVVVNIANWPAQRLEHWETLLKARSIENQYFVTGGLS